MRNIILLVIFLFITAAPARAQHDDISHGDRANIQQPAPEIRLVLPPGSLFYGDGVYRGPLQITQIQPGINQNYGPHLVTEDQLDTANAKIKSLCDILIKLIDRIEALEDDVQRLKIEAEHPSCEN